MSCAHELERLERRALLAGISFANAVNFNGGEEPQGIASADFNNDGKLDIVVSNYTAGKLSVMNGNGLGSLGSATAYTAGANISGALAGDLNGDSKPDIVS